MLRPNEFTTQPRLLETIKSFWSTCVEGLTRWQAANRTHSSTQSRSLATDAQVHKSARRLPLPRAVKAKIEPAIRQPINNSTLHLQSHVNTLEHELESITAELRQSKDQLQKASIEQQKLRSALSMARGLQESLLPHGTPQIVGLDIYAISKPAQEVNGDFYDFIKCEQPNLTFTIGDISGKGMAAALMMTMTRKVLRTANKILEQPTPGIMLDYSNKDLYEELSNTGMFATTFVGQFASESRLLQYSNAGHSPVIYRAAAEDATMLVADGAPIGVLAENFFEERQIILQPGAILVIATDGITDARNPAGKMFGYERLLYLINKHADKSASEIAHIVFQTVAYFEAGRSQDDDQTLMVLKGA